MMRYLKTRLSANPRPSIYRTVLKRLGLRVKSSLSIEHITFHFRDNVRIADTTRGFKPGGLGGYGSGAAPMKFLLAPNVEITSRAR